MLFTNMNDPFLLSINIMDKGDIVNFFDNKNFEIED